MHARSQLANELLQLVRFIAAGDTRSALEVVSARHWDPSGGLRSVPRPIALELRLHYNELGRVLCQPDPSERAALDLCAKIRHCIEAWAQDRLDRDVG